MDRKNKYLTKIRINLFLISLLFYTNNSLNLDKNKKSFLNNVNNENQENKKIISSSPFKFKNQKNNLDTFEIERSFNVTKNHK